MHRIISRQRQRAALYGWIKWTPVLAFPFSLMFFDAWLNIETRNNDYAVGRLSSQVRSLTSELEHVRVLRAQQENLGDLGAKAPNIGLVEPNPNQVVTVRWDGQWRERAPQAPFALARAQGTIDAGTAAAPVQPLIAPKAPVQPESASQHPMTGPVPAPSTPETSGLVPALASIESLEEAKLLGTVVME